jgi:hypothetical protein
MSKKIKFIYHATPIAGNELIETPMPVSGSKMVPEWYSKSERFLGDVKKPVIKNLSFNAGVKTCVPFLDGITAGYMMTTWTDIQVTPIDDTTSEMNWLSLPDPIKVRPKELGELIPRPAGHCEDHFTWVTQWGVELPKGYSLFVTHPANRFDLPFTTLSGLMDADKSFSSGNLPFFLRANWEGIIPAGTPFAQLIPVKRESWVSEKGSKEDTKKAVQASYNSTAVTSGLYKKKLWTKKEYN